MLYLGIYDAEDKSTSFFAVSAPMRRNVTLIFEDIGGTYALTVTVQSGDSWSSRVGRAPAVVNTRIGRLDYIGSGGRERNAYLPAAVCTAGIDPCVAPVAAVSDGCAGIRNADIAPGGIIVCVSHERQCLGEPAVAVAAGEVKAV